mgnify:CR=1 FL=1
MVIDWDLISIGIILYSAFILKCTSMPSESLSPHDLSPLVNYYHPPDWGSW